MSAPSSGEKLPHPAWIIREWLRETKHSQTWLAEQIGHTPKHVNHILNGRSLWSAATAARIEQATDGYITALELMQMKAEYEISLAGDER